MQKMEPYIPTAARILISLIFIASSTNLIVNWSSSLAYMEAKGVVWAEVFLFLTIVIEVACWISLVVGFKVRWSTLLLCLLLIPITLVMHDFWAIEGPGRMGHVFTFFKNLGLIGGLLLVYLQGAGPFSLDKRFA